MTLLLARELSDRITAVGIVAGAYYGADLDNSQLRPVPAIFFHGQADPIATYEGGFYERAGMTIPSVPEFVCFLCPGK